VSSAASCPSCGDRAERGQLVCLACGGRIALGRPRAWSRAWRPAVVLGGFLGLLAAISLGFALSELTSGNDGGRADRVAAASPAEPAAGPPAPTDSTPPAEPVSTEPRRRAPLDWRAGARAHTVVLVTTSDRPAAVRVARRARRSGLEAGLLDAGEYNLGEGLWIVFAGRFDTRTAAARQAVRLGERYPGAYPQLIQRPQ
jgi:hypothetical protein